MYVGCTVMYALQGLMVNKDDVYISYQSMYHVHEIVNHVNIHSLYVSFCVIYRNLPSKRTL